MNRVIDPHLHLFDLQQGKYFWLQEGSAPHWPDKQLIRRDFHESVLSLNPPVELSGFVHIEAGFDNELPWRELEWLESHCQLPFKSVAYADLLSDNFEQDLAHLARFNSLVGVRHILDDQAEAILSRELAIENLATLADKGLLFEAQLRLDNIPAVEALNRVLSDHAQLKVVINHAGLPRALSDVWMSSVMLLAQHPECYIKCSGWEMYHRDWRVESVELMIDFTIKQFGLTRVMLASNFPVSELSCSYQEVWQRYLNEMKWKGFEQEMLVYENAKRIYQFE